MRNRRTLTIHLLALAAFSAALYLPMMGRGFILDDFGHLFVAGQESVRFGLTRAAGGPYYTPVAYVSFKTDWILWGARPFPWAVTNLLLHIANTVLLYFLALRLWGSSMAAWWSAFGFALLFPANVVAVLWIATRAHLIAALFYLAAMIAALRFTRTENCKIGAAVAVIACAAASMFAKESAVTVLAAIAIVIVYERVRQGRKVISLPHLGLMGGLLAALGVYLGLRANSGAIPINFSGGPISYSLSPATLGKNLLVYGWRTYGLLTFVAIAVAVSLRLRGLRPRRGAVNKNDLLLSGLLFVVALTPFALLPKQPGIYSYLPGIPAALLLGAVAGSLCKGVFGRRRAAASLAPIVLVVGVFVAFTVKDSLKWIQLAEVNTAVLSQIAVQQPKVKPSTFVLLSYRETDAANRFPEGFGNWCFPWALRVLYADRTVDGKIIRQGESYSIGDKLAEVHFSYVRGESPTVIKTSRDLPQS